MKLLFVEHGLSPEIRTARWQHRLTPYWKRISGGCHLDRKTDELIRTVGFQIDTVDTGYVKVRNPSPSSKECVANHAGVVDPDGRGARRRKRFTLNPVLVTTSLFFWHIVWGIPGALRRKPTGEPRRPPASSRRPS